MRCKACRRPLRNPASIKYQLGPDCLRKAVKSGNAPIDALTELTEWKRRKKAATERIDNEQPIRDTLTIDMFEKPREDAIAALLAAADECRSFGVVVRLEIEQ